ncbi:MAG TPA: hypothetical protein VFQ73_05440 [Flavisolibacter sp.]|nr:hypothetical protein [Flavisolibacter sp.]
MKNNSIIILLLLIFIVPKPGNAQTVNWTSFGNGLKHIINLNAGFDNSATIGIGYGQKLNTSFPLLLSVEYSAPAGKTIFDDFKTKLGGQAEVVKAGRFSATVKAYGIFRRNESDYVRLLNFGSEFSTVMGYYKSSWHAAGELGFDKAIITHVQHKDIMKESYPGIKDGWYMPTGGNFFYGIQTGKSFKNNDVYIRIGKTVAQDLKNKATIPLYFQLGVNGRF